MIPTVPNTDITMPQRKKANTNGGRVTARDLLNAVMGLGSRIDSLGERDDAAVERHEQLSDQMTDLHTKMHDLRETTNERLHEMETDIMTIKRPLTLLTNGWTKAIALSGGVGTISAAVAQLELWRFIPGL